MMSGARGRLKLQQRMRLNMRLRMASHLQSRLRDWGGRGCKLVWQRQVDRDSAKAANADTAEKLEKPADKQQRS